MSAKTLLRQIQECNARAIAETGDVDPIRVETILNQWICDEELRQEVVCGLAEYLAAAANGAVIDLDHWTPSRARRHTKR